MIVFAVEHHTSTALLPRLRPRSAREAAPTMTTGLRVPVIACSLSTGRLRRRAGEVYLFGRNGSLIFKRFHGKHSRFMSDYSFHFYIFDKITKSLAEVLVIIEMRQDSAAPIFKLTKATKGPQLGRPFHYEVHQTYFSSCKHRLCCRRFFPTDTLAPEASHGSWSA